MRDTRGAIVMARKIIESDIFSLKPDKWFKIWVFILLTSNYKDIKTFKRGEVFTTYQEICSYTKATRNEVDHCIRWLKQAKQIATRKATRGLYINVLKYDFYQTLNAYKSETESDIKSDLSAIQKRHKSDTISKYVKKDKYVKKGESEIADALSPPALITKSFFKGIQDLKSNSEHKSEIITEEAITVKKFLQEIQIKYPFASKEIIWKEINKFERYWTELNSTGKKERWQTEKTFQVDRRLVTWFGKLNQFKKETESKYEPGKIIIKSKS